MSDEPLTDEELASMQERADGHEHIFECQEDSRALLDEVRRLRSQLATIQASHRTPAGRKSQ